MNRFSKKMMQAIALWAAFATMAKAGTISDARRFSEVLIGILDFMLYLSGFIGIIMLILSGIMYILSRGNEELASKAKYSVRYVVAGMVFVLGSLALVRTITMIIGS